MKVKPDWINKVAVAGLILSLVGGGLWFWDHNHYILPSILEPSIDPFADPPAEHNVLNRFVLRLRYARWTRIEEEDRKINDRRIRDGFRELKFAGNRFWFSYYPADDSNGVDGEIVVSEGGKILVVVLDPDYNGREHPMQEDTKFLRGGEKTLFLETRNGRTEWEILDFSDGWERSDFPPFELVPPPAKNSFPTTPPPIGKEARFKDGLGNELFLEELKDIPKAKEKGNNFE